MEAYAWGVFFGLLLSLFRFCSTVWQMRSLKARNLRKAGLYLHRVKGLYQAKKNTAEGWMMYAVGLFIIKPLCSWLYPAWYLADKFGKRKSRSHLNRVFADKLSRKVLSKEEVITLLDDYSIFAFPTQEVLAMEYGSANSPINGEAETPFDLLCHEHYDDDTSFNTIVNPSTKTYKTTIRWDMNKSIFECEYKVKDLDIEVRVINQLFETPGSKSEYSIRDNVVQEDVVRRGKSEWTSDKEIEAQISTLKQNVQWDVMRFSEMKMWLMGNHSGISHIEYRKHLQLQRMRIESGRRACFDELIKFGVQIAFDEKHKLTTGYKDGVSEEMKDAAGEWFVQKRYKTLGITRDELFDGEVLLRQIEKTLRRSEAA